MMAVELYEVNGNPNVGLYAVPTDKYVLASEHLPENFLALLERVFKVELVIINFEPRFIGALALANQNGLVFSPIIHEDAINQIRMSLPDLNILQVKFDYFAFGNLAITTESQTLVSPIIPKVTQRSVADVLDTEVSTLKLNDSDLIGSLVYTNNQGAVISPIVEDNAEIENVSELLDLSSVQVSTVNRGSQFPAGGIIANSKGAILGQNTTGIEAIAITSALFPS